MNKINGTIVRSCAGRDSGDYFVVIACDSLGFFYIANGKDRKLNKPKKKNVKHLQFTKTVIDLDDITDRKLRKFLREYESLNNI
ncbi:MAG: KOW domain-containing RNA-binding protein [Ruminococcus sp.]|nr:KOW domain-containing RNA-binding protein [Ruminococcus sp.]MCD7800735.1 KOW domain-containing RNA-binding protein [Ruminococcus sp.]